MATYELRALSMGEILDESFGLYREHFATLIAIAVVWTGLPMLLAIYVEMGGGFIVHPLTSLIVGLLRGIGGLFATAGTVWVISEIYMGRDPAVGDALGAASSRVGKLFVAGLAKYLVIGLGMLLFLVPGIIAACGYAVVVPVVILEQVGSGTDALGRSWTLTKGYKGKAFSLGLAVFALIYLPFLAAGVLAGVFTGSETVVNVAAELLSFLVYPFMAAVGTLFYYDLRVRQEAFDLEHLSQQLDAAR
jgi:uncharacterized membrane protein